MGSACPLGRPSPPASSKGNKRALIVATPSGSDNGLCFPDPRASQGIREPLTFQETTWDTSIHKCSEQRQDHGWRVSLPPPLPRPCPLCPPYTYTLLAHPLHPGRQANKPVAEFAGPSKLGQKCVSNSQEQAWECDE